ncbi:MAG: BrnT family toxin [Blastocatellia bacterium]
MRYNWDPSKAKANPEKHGVGFEEAREVFDDPHAFHFFDAAHSIGEIRYNVIGFSRQRLLFIVYTERGEQTLRIISAREADKFHRKIYEQQDY